MEEEKEEEEEVGVDRGTTQSVSLPCIPPSLRKISKGIGERARQEGYSEPNIAKLFTPNLFVVP